MTYCRPSKEGFDIVIGNPPYLESRSSNFSESLKVSLQSEIKRRLSDAGAFPRGADLLIFFYELSLRLLNKKGYNVFITENYVAFHRLRKTISEFFIEEV